MILVSGVHRVPNTISLLLMNLDIEKVNVIICAHTTLCIKTSQNSFGGNIVCDTVEFCGSLLVNTTSSFCVPLVHKILRNCVLKYKYVGDCVVSM